MLAINKDEQVPILQVANCSLIGERILTVPRLP